VSLSFTTNLEISNEDFAAMDKLVGMEGWCLFSPNELETKDIPKENAPSEGKSMRERMRAMHWVYWDTNTDKSVPFVQWYDRYQEAYMQRLKDKLPERS